MEHGLHQGHTDFSGLHTSLHQCCINLGQARIGGHHIDSFLWVIGSREHINTDPKSYAKWIVSNIHFTCIMSEVLVYHVYG